jgi:FtsP/CotA-like multicopper oxidase with cupredoxin domain
MRGKSLARSLFLLTLLLPTAVAVWAQTPPPDCGVAPQGRPWGCYLKTDYPPAIRPVGDELSSSLVIRIRDGMYTPQWTGKLCQGTVVACNRDNNCTSFPPGKCIAVMVCKATGKTCTSSTDCDTGDTCVATSTWGWRSMSLRSYGSPKDPSQPINPADPNDPNIRWGLPGPVFHARAQTLTDPAQPPGPGNPVVKEGTRIKINLYNYLPSTTYDLAHTCNAASYNACGPAVCSNNPSKSCTLQTDCPGGACSPTTSYCSNNPNQKCTQQSECAAGGVCLPITTYCSNDLSKRCSANSDCPGGTCNAINCSDSATQCCSNDSSKTCSQSSDCSTGGTCGPFNCSDAVKQCGQKTCVTGIPVPQKDPNCYHGDNITNFHLHGTHVSPQRPQDFVLLNLFPYNSTGVPTGENYAVGEYQVNVNPLPWNQAPGTHWYHPHKHGSTSIQVLNGMAGGLVIEGAFDDWLSKLYSGKLIDRVMAVQQISGGVNFFNPGSAPAKALVNGMATPVIQMRPGEIQRWRFVGGTAQASAQLEIGIDPRIREVRQIAQDGVQFAWQNYDRQPLRDTSGTYSNFKLSPGNRVDFLIKAPDRAGIYTITSRIFIDDISQTAEEFFNIDETSVAQRVPPTLVPQNRVPVDFKGNPLLFTIEVAGTPNPMELPVTEATDRDCKQSPKPVRCWPATPYFLKDLGEPDAGPVNLAFKIDGQLQRQPNSFFINDSQYQKDCSGVTMTLGKTEDWFVANVLGNNNTELLPHPFHIHTNPFQVRRNADRKFDPPYVWQDTISLPMPDDEPTDRPAGPIYSNAEAQVKCPIACQADNATWNGQWTTVIPNKLSVCGCQVKSDDVALRHRFDDYTGAYVIHCHFLGHEDRGMMWNVQTVCPASGYGQTQANGGADSCGTTKPQLPQCTNTGMSSGHSH